MSQKRSLAQTDITETEAPSLKKLRRGNKENISDPNKSKPKKKKAAKPFQCKAIGYLCGTFECLNTARLEFKALFGMNKLCIAWSDIKCSQIRQAFNPMAALFDFDFDGMQRAAQLLNNMKTERVEIDINKIDSIHFSNGGDSIRLEIITNYPPTFTKQMSSHGKNKFNKSTDPTNGNALKYRKHIIFLGKKATANNIYSMEEKLKNGSAKIKQLIDDEVYKEFTNITMTDTYDVEYNDDDIDKKKKSIKKKRKKAKWDSEDDDLYEEEEKQSKNKSGKKNKRKRKKSTVEDSDEEWLP